MRPRRFDQAQELADKFKDGQAVILNLESTERDVARRLIDSLVTSAPPRDREEWAARARARAAQRFAPKT